MYGSHWTKSEERLFTFNSMYISIKKSEKKINVALWYLKIVSLKQWIENEKEKNIFFPTSFF